MTKIITSENRIIFDGHASTREECETISLMCEELVKSDKFKTVKYESGYAEFEKVGNTNDLKFPPALASDWTVAFYLDGVLKGSIVKKISKEMVNDEDNVSVNGSIATVNLLIAGGYETYEYDYGVQLDSATLVGGTGEVGPGYTVYAISKPATSRKSIDLTTLPGWSFLSSGSHSIAIVAKADGYRDSEPSAAVMVTKAAEVTLISFTIGGKSYQAEEGMTWAEWVNSSYNTGGYYIGEYGVYSSSGGSRVALEQDSIDLVMSSDTITSGHNYGTYLGGSSGK